MRVLVFLVAFIAAPAWATTYYVCPTSGEYGTEDGTSIENCFDGPADVSGLAPGDTLIFCVPEGESFGPADTEGALNGYTIDSSGEEGAPITISGDCSSQGMSARAVWDQAGDTRAIRILDALDRSWLIYEKFELRNSVMTGISLRSSNSEGNQNDATKSSNIIIRDVWIHGNRGTDVQGIGIQAWVTNLTIENCRIWDNSGDNVWVHGNNGVFRGNYLEGADATGHGVGDEFQCGSGGDNANDSCTGWLIEDNVFVHTAKAKQALLVSATSTGDSGQTIVRRNRLYCPQDNDGAGCMTLHRIQGVLVTQNYVEAAAGIANSSDSTGTSGNIIESNIVWSRANDGGSAGIQFPYGNGHVVRGNTVYGFYRGIIVAGSNSVVRGNIVMEINGNGVVAGSANTNESYNICYRCALTTESAFPYTAGTGSSTVNPRLVDPTNGDFRLGLNSPAWRAAGDFCAQEARGRTRTPPCSIGAIEPGAGDPLITERTLR